MFRFSGSIFLVEEKNIWTVHELDDGCKKVLKITVWDGAVNDLVSD